MPTYRVTDPRSGKTLRLTGDSPPTEQELEQIFSQSTQKPEGMLAQLGDAFLDARPAPHLPRMRELPYAGMKALDAAAFGLIPSQAYENLPKPQGFESNLGSGAMQLGGMVAGGPGRLAAGAGRIATKAVPALAKNMLGRAALRAGEGAIAGATEDLTDLQNAPQRAGSYAAANVLIPPVVQGAVKGARALVGGAKNVGKAVQKVANVGPVQKPTSLRTTLPEETLRRMSPSDQRRYFDLQADRVRRQTSKELSRLTPEEAALQIAEQERGIQLKRQQLSQKSQAALQEITNKEKFKLEQLKQESEGIKQAMQQKGAVSTLRVREKFSGVARKQSEQYQKFIDDALDQNPNATFSREEIGQALERVYPDNPEKAKEVFQTIFPSAPGQPWTSANAKDVIRAIRGLSREVSTTAKQGNRVYTYQEKIADDAKHELIRVLENKGVSGFEEANKFWSKWAPIRNQAIRDFKPYVTSRTMTETGTRRLMQVARTKDPGNTEYIKQLENLLGEDLSSEIKGLAQKLDATKKAQAALRIRTQTMRQLVQQNRTSESARLSDEAYQLKRQSIERQAQIATRRASLEGSRDRRLTTIESRKHELSKLETRRKIIRDALIAAGGLTIAGKIGGELFKRGESVLR